MAKQPPTETSGLRRLRNQFLSRLQQELLGFRSDDGVPNFADSGTPRSVNVAKELVKILGMKLDVRNTKEQTAGAKFTELVRSFIQDAFQLLAHVRPGNWHFSTSQAKEGIAVFEQFEHLAELKELLKDKRALKSALGSGYQIKPDITVARAPMTDAQLDEGATVIGKDNSVAAFSPLRAANRKVPTLLLHASISCKWTMRSDRAQNARTEALNLIRNRKGHTPRICLVTFEPTPNIIASMALGTGDLDCVYHGALPELKQAVENVASEDAIELLTMLIDGRRLRDLADLPLDLVI